MVDHKLQIVLTGKDVTQRAFKSVQGRVANLRKDFAGLTQGVGYMKAAFAGLAAAGVSHVIKSSLDMADALGKTADVIGISTDALQEYQHVANLSGVNTDLLQTSLTAFSKRIGEARQGTGALTTFLKKFDEQLLENIKNSKSTDEALRLVFERMGNTASATDRAALAAAAFSRAGVKMVNFVKDGAEGLAAMRQEARDLGIVMDEDLIRASERANDELTRLSTVASAHLKVAVVELAPEIERLASGLLKLAKYAGLRSISRTAQEAAELSSKGLLDIVAFRKATFLQRQEMVDFAKERHKAGRIDFDQRNAQISLEKDYLRILQDVKKEGQEQVKKITPTVAVKQKLKFDTGSGEVFNDLKVLFDTYETELPKRLQESLRRSSEAVKGAFDIDDMAADPGAMFEAYDESIQKRLEESRQRWEEHNQALVDLTQETAEAMRQTFSDVFFDFFTGELKTLEDYVNSLSRSLARTASDLLSKQLVEGLFAAGAGGGSGAGAGGFFGKIFAGLFHAGGEVGKDRPPMRAVPAAAFAGAPRLHSGLLPGEYPAILQRGEAVIPRSEVKSRSRRRPFQPIFNVNVAAPNGRITPQSLNQLQTALGVSVQRAMRRNT